MSEQKYCVWCGSAYTGQAKYCPHCGKNPDPAEHQLSDWLYSHTKDKLKGDIEGSLYEKLKNWLLSHLYGMVLSVTLVATTVTAVAGGTGHIKQVSRPPQALGGNIQTPVTPDMPDIPDVQEILSLSDRLEYTITDYLAAVNSSGGEMTAELQRLMLPDYVGVEGYHEALTDRWTDKKADTSRIVADHCARSHSTMWCSPSRVYLELQSKGYTPYYSTGYNALYETPEAEGGADIVFEYLFTVVEVDGKWYIAESLEYDHDRELFDGEMREGEDVYTSPDFM